MNEPRTFKVQSPHMQGSDIEAWQKWLLKKFHSWDIDYPLVIDGDYGVATRSATATLMRCWGVTDTGDAMEHGLTPAWRSKLRHDGRNKTEFAAFNSEAITDFRHRVRLRYVHKDVAAPLGKILEHSWGWHPGIHDGVDLICVPEAPLMAIVTGRVIRADAGGWWGLGAPSDPALKAKGDGIIVIRATVEVGPFKKGMNFCYGHAEGAVVQEGQQVHAGQHIGHAGFANAWHVHFMVNDRNDDRGLGDRDPWPYVAYALEHSS